MRNVIFQKDLVKARILHLHIEYTLKYAVRKSA